MQYFHDQIVHFYIQWEGEHFYCDAYILRQTTCPSASLLVYPDGLISDSASGVRFKSKHTTPDIVYVESILHFTRFYGKGRRNQLTLKY